MTALAGVLVVGAAVVITARSYGPSGARRTWAGGWRWLATRGASEALLAGVIIGVVLVLGRAALS